MPLMSHKAYTSHLYERQLTKYNLYLESIARNLPQSVAAYSKLFFHDLIIYSVRYISPDNIVIEVGWYQIEFFNVSKHMDLSGSVEHAWLWHEIFRESNGLWSSFTITDGEDFSICFRDVTVVDTLKKEVIIPCFDKDPASKFKHKHKHKSKRHR